MEWNHVPLALLPSLRSQARGVRDHGTGMETITQCLSLPVSQNCYSIYSLLPIFVFSLGFLSETWKLWEQTPTLFCLRLPNTYSGFVCPILLFAWLNAVPGKMYLWASVKSMTCLQHPWGSSEVSVSRLWHVSMCKCTLMPICLMPVGSIRS